MFFHGMSQLHECVQLATNLQYFSIIENPFRFYCKKQFRNERTAESDASRQRDKKAVAAFETTTALSVRMKGLEPPRPETLDPKSNAATNYATCAFVLQS